MARVFPAIALVAAQLMALAASEVVEFNYDIARSYAGNGISFLPTDRNPLPAHLLMGLEASVYSTTTTTTTTTPAVIPCATTDVATVSGEVTVLIAISKCLSQASVDVITNWAKTLQASQKTFFQNGQSAAIKFEVASVPGSCQALSEANAHGQGPLLADEERLAGFREFARVLDAMPSSTPTENFVNKTSDTTVTVKTKLPVAVVSFVDNDKTFTTVQEYELTAKISTTFNFRICEKGKNCDGKFENCITLNDAVDVFMYSPFKVATTLNCASLAGGYPVSYIDSANNRKCACTCPAGTKLSSDNKKCETVNENECQCVWANAPGGGYKKKIDTAITTCEFKNIATTWNVPPPVPLDNYVDKRRENQNDANSALFKLTNGPHIDLLSDRIEDPVYNIDGSTLTSYPSKADSKIKSLPKSKAGPAFTSIKSSYTWSDYQSNRAAKIDSLKYTAYGKYSLEVDAFDYNTTSADCKGCIAIVDNFRPEATTPCPKPICDNSTSDCDTSEGIVELTSSSLVLIETQIKNYYNYQDLAKNDVCAANASPKRCDADCIEVMNFDDNKYSSKNTNYRSDGANFYTASDIKSDLNKVGTLCKEDLEKETPVAYGQCTRCISLETTLKEYWTDFTCGRDYDTEKCEGKAGQTCALKQCIAVFGDTIAVSSATIKSDVKKESDNVVKELVQKDYNTDTQVHVALECTKFVDNAKASSWDPKCVYKAKVQDLIDIDTKKNDNSIFSNKDAKDFVAWRYRIDTESWSAWSTQNQYTFNKAETKIAIEAWTKCGIVRKFFFYVNLHLNNQIDVCSNFRAMWYQSTNTKLQAPDSFCMYPKSDFAEVTFDYHANIGLEFSPDRLSMNIAGVECRLTYDECKSGGAKIVDVKADSREIVSRFAVLARRTPTSPLTKFHVTCDFTYKRYGNQDALKQTCNQDFYITDCTGPVIDKPCPLDDPTCSADTCVTSALPAPYEACGGNIVSLDKNSNTVFTSASTADSSCCEFCSAKYTTTCKTLSALPGGTTEIKRCEPAPKTGTASRGSYYNLAAADALQSVTESSTGTATLLLSASAMVALVALVVVKRRHAAAATKDAVMDDAYYPLLN